MEKKYRAWSNGRMEYSELMGLPKFFTLFDNDYDKSPVTQITGMRDINGVDVYEGDIIKFRFVSGIDLRLKGSIAYHPDELRYEVEIIGWQSDGMTVLSYDIQKFSEVEVVGNIYANRDLLEESKPRN